MTGGEKRKKDSRQRLIQTDTVSTLCWFLLLSQTCWPWNGRNNPAILQNLNLFLYLSAVKFVNWVIRLQNASFPFHSRQKSTHTVGTLSVLRDWQFCPLLQQLKMERGNGNRALRHTSSFQRESGQAWIHGVEEQIVKVHLNPQLPLSSVRIKLWAAFTSLTPICLHNQDLGAFPPKLQNGTTPEPESWTPSSHTNLLYLFHLQPRRREKMLTSP